MSQADETRSTVGQLLEAAGGAVPDDALVVVPGDAPAESELPWQFLSFEEGAPEAIGSGGRPGDSASAIVALERDRTKGAGFLALPAPSHQWLDELPLFGDHCRSRYQVLLESELGMLFDLRPTGKIEKAEPPESAVAEQAAPHAELDPGAEPATESASGEFDAVDVLAEPLERLVRNGTYSGDEFRRFEQYGVHVIPMGDFDPVPNTSQLADEIWQRETELVGIDMNDEEQLRLLQQVFPRFRTEYEALPDSPGDDPDDFYLGNGLFDGTDALVLYCMLRHLQPRRVIHVESGHSLRLAAQAVAANGSGEITCIDPSADPGLQAGVHGLTKLITAPVEEQPLDLFTQLQANDVLFIDSSHVVQIGGDVTFLFLEVLPRLQPGVVVHMHDIFLPREYRRDWVIDDLRFWNEQYLLQAFLAFNSAYRVLLGNTFLLARYPDEFHTTFPTSPWLGGGSFWMQRTEAG